jgi:hypothetical protein
MSHGPAEKLAEDRCTHEDWKVQFISRKAFDRGMHILASIDEETLGQYLYRCTLSEKPGSAIDGSYCLPLSKRSSRQTC